MPLAIQSPARSCRKRFGIPLRLHQTLPQEKYQQRAHRLALPLICHVLARFRAEQLAAATAATKLKLSRSRPLAIQPPVGRREEKAT